MSNTLNGVFRKKKGASVNGTVGTMTRVSVNVPSKVNRQTNATLIRRYTRDGFEWNKWALPTIAQLKTTGEQFLLDGDHRRHMYKQFHPDEEDMPAWVIEVEDVKEFHLGISGEGRQSFKDVKQYRRRKRWL